jgi:hypothetical protein
MGPAQLDAIAEGEARDAGGVQRALSRLQEHGEVGLVFEANCAR